jgi:hypothetical protein
MFVIYYSSFVYPERKILLRVSLAVLIGIIFLFSCSRNNFFYSSFPLDPSSPWPKFRQNAMQDGRSPIHPSKSGGGLWEFHTGQGIFSTPVVGSDGTIYVGSADNIFYAINPDGTLKWKLQTNGLIDSAALLDNKGRVYFGSGDGKLYALNAGTGQTVWTYLADDPSTNSAYIRWFEGNVAIGPNGNLYVPNDNFFIYCIDRDTGNPIWKFKMNDQTWSLPAVDPSTGMLFGGNNNMLSLFGKNIYSTNANGKLQWSDFVNGTIAASPLLTSNGEMILGAFDGYVYAFKPERANGSGILGPAIIFIRALPCFLTINHASGTPATMSRADTVRPIPNDHKTAFCMRAVTAAVNVRFVVKIIRFVSHSVAAETHARKIL